MDPGHPSSKNMSGSDQEEMPNKVTKKAKVVCREECKEVCTEVEAQKDEKGRVLNSKGEREKEKAATFFDECTVGDKPQNKVKGKFCMHSHKFFFTYSGLSEDFGTKEELLEFLEGNIGAGRSIVEYRIGRELHPEPKDPEKPYHFHAYFCTEKKIKVKDPNRFDWKGHHGDYYSIGKNGHPKYKHLPVAQQRQFVIDYVGKDGDYIEKLDAIASALTDKELPERMTFEAQSYPEAMEMGFKEDPGMMMKNFSNVQKAMKYIHEQSEKRNPPKYDLSEFKHPPLDLKKAVILYGKANCQKTQFAKAHFKNPLEVSNRDSMRKFKEGWHDGLIINDMDFNSDGKAKESEKWNIEEVKTLLGDQETDREISVRGTNAFAKIPKEVPVIITHNKNNPFDIFTYVFKGKTTADIEAVKRRVGQIVKVTDDLCQLTADNKLPTDTSPPVRKMVKSILKQLREDAQEGKITLGEEDCSEAARLLGACRKRSRN
jgi:hypothetical protein